MAAERAVRAVAAGVAAPLLALLAALGALGLPVPPAAAEEAPPLQVLFVLDVSGSMGRTIDGSSQTLLQGATAALAQVSRTLPPEVALGLRVYGATYGGEDRDTSCADTQLVVPPAAGSAKAVVEAATGLAPLGETPIGRSLLAAAGDFAGERTSGQRVVVLISDGEDTCHPPDPRPCRAARTVERRDPVVRVETVGLALSGQKQAVDALRCVAETTGGQYYAADNAQGLAAALAQIAESTIERLGPGKPVTGALRPEDAPVVTEGAYRIKLRPGTMRWFRFEAAEGDLPEVLATVQGVSGLRVPYYGRSCETWHVQLFNPYGEGGTYPPYANTNIFDGTGFAGAGGRGAKPISATADGIDFPGQWTFSLALAPTDDPILRELPRCADYFPRDTPFDVRFTLTLDADAQPDLPDNTIGGDGGDTPAASPSSDPLVSPSPTLTEPPAGAGSTATTGAADDAGGFISPDLPAAAADEPEPGVDWAGTAVAVLVAALVGLLVLLFVRWRRNRFP